MMSVSVEALEEAELRLQREELKWKESVNGRGRSSTDDDDDKEEGLFMVDSDGGVAAVLQETLFRRQLLIDRCGSRYTDYFCYGMFVCVCVFALFTPAVNSVSADLTVRLICLLQIHY